MAATIADLGARVLRRLGVAVVAASDRPRLSAPIGETEIATRALQFLGVLASDEAPSADDEQTAREKVRTIHDSLVAQGLVPWEVTSIPAAVAEEYTRLVAMHLAPVFGKTADPAQLDAIEARIRRVSLLMTAPDVAERAVLDVHAVLDARGMTRWSLFDIADFAEPAYVALAANLVAPQFGLPADPNADVAAMRTLAQVIALPSNGEHVRAEFF